MTYAQYLENRQQHAGDPNASLAHTYVKPFHMAGNVWYVGDKRVCSHLIDTGDGLILIDTGFPRTEFLLLQSIWEAGFNPKDIKILLHSHGHGDHYGATEPFVTTFGCKTYMGAADATLFREHPEKFKTFDGTPMKMFVPDVELYDGDVIELGNVKILCLATPGHSPGVFSFFFDIVEGGKTYRAGTFGGAGFNTLYREAFTKHGYPETTQQDFLNSVNKVMDERVDVVLENHPASTFKKRDAALANPNGPNPFIDPAEWRKNLVSLHERITALIEAGY
jgi:metallo-beta-lactamase class B